MLNVHIWPILMGKKFGQFGQIWAYLVKNGQTARKFFTAKRLKYFFKQKYFSETRINLQPIYGARFLI
jgi:hypothetical protein